MEEFKGRCEKCGKVITESMRWVQKISGEGVEQVIKRWHWNCAPKDFK